MPKYTREDNVDIRVSLDGVPYGAGWDTIEGGDLEAADTKYRPGSMGKEVSLGGPSSRSDMTVTIQMSDVVAGWITKFENRNGRGALKISWTYLDAEGLPASATQTRTGILKTVTPPPMDASGNAAVKFSIVGSMNEQAA